MITRKPTSRNMNVQQLQKPRYLVVLVIVCFASAIFGCQKMIEQRKQYYYNKGMQLFKNKEYMAAAEELERAIQFDRKNFDALYLHGLCKYSLGNYGPALQSFRKALAERPADRDVKIKIAECLLQVRSWESISFFVLEIIPMADTDRDARILALKYYIMSDDFVKAEELIKNILNHGEQDQTFYALLVQYATKKNKLSDAREVVLKHFTVTADWMQAIQSLIKKLYREEHYGDLEQIYVKLIEKSENKLPYQQELAKLYRKRGAEKEEEELLTSMLQDNPKNLAIKRHYVDFLNYYNRQTQAEAFLVEEINRQPHNIELQKILIETCMNTAQQQKAFDAVERVLSTLRVDDTRYYDFQVILANLNFKSGAVDKAKTIVTDILRKNRLNRDARFLLSRILLQEGDTISAIGELRQLVRENPEIAEYNYYMGIAHEMRGEFVLAEKAFRGALDAAPDYKDALVKWVTIYPKEGSLSEVENRINKYLELHPDDKEIAQLQESIRRSKSNILSRPMISDSTTM